MEHQEYKELLELSAFDTADEAQARALEEHLATCAECRSELAELRDAAGLLAHAATPLAPSSEVRARILAAAGSPANAGAGKPVETARVVPFAQRLRPNLWPNLLKIAAAVAFVALAIGLFVMWRRNVKSEREIARLTHEMTLQQRLINKEHDARLREHDALVLLSSRDAKKMELAGTQTAQNARAMFVFDQKSGRAVLMTDGLPATPADKAYEVWFIPKGHSPMAGKTFSVDSSGHAMLIAQMPPEAMENAVIAITLEPKKGSAVPTGAIYLSSPSS
jgi:anti-sigma-K factor RskA